MDLPALEARIRRLDQLAEGLTAEIFRATKHRNLAEYNNAVFAMREAAYRARAALAKVVERMK